MMLGRLQVPPTVKKGEPFEIKLLLQHAMETGFRRDMNGQSIAMNVIDKVTCRVGGREVFSAELGSGIAANPYLSFFAVASEPGEVEVEWSDDRGERGRMTARFTVS